MRAELNVCCIFMRDLTGFSAKKHALIYEKNTPKARGLVLGLVSRVEFCVRLVSVLVDYCGNESRLYRPVLT